jgi:hypothetical protein
MLKCLCHFGMYCLKTTLPLKRTISLSAASCSEGLCSFENALFRIPNISCIFHSDNFRPSFQIYSGFLGTVRSKECVGICLVSSCCCRKACKILLYCPVVCQLVSYGMLHIYCYSQQEKRFIFIHVRYWRWSIVKCVCVMVIVSVSLTISSAITSARKKETNKQVDWSCYLCVVLHRSSFFWDPL